MKPEVGMFYRYKGQIGKYKKITELDRYPSFTNNYLRKNEVILLNNAKFSYNIIDILEEGDILVDDTNRKLEILLIDNELMVRNAGLIYDNNYYIPIKSIAIKSVVTKEQFEQMAYKVDE